MKTLLQPVMALAIGAASLSFAPRPPSVRHAPSGEALVVYLARHGTSAFDPSQPWIAGVVPDPPLSPIGDAEAARLAALARQLGIRRIVTSPLLRARATAERAVETTGASLTVDSGLSEFHVGDLFGRDWSRPPYSAQLDSLFLDTLQARPGGESAEAFARRVRTSLARVAADPTPGPVLIVAHALVNRTMVGAARSESLGSSMRTAAQRHHVLYRVDWSGTRWLWRDSLMY